jgi:hypothetical protein
MSFLIAQQFAGLVDALRFDEAANLLAKDCHYEYVEGKYQGCDNIINMYRQNHLQSLKIFDERTYASSVEEAGENTYKITFTDKIRKGAAWHEFTSFQFVKVEGEQIVDIRHVDMPDEMTALRVFYQRAINMAKL